MCFALQAWHQESAPSSSAQPSSIAAISMNAQLRLGWALDDFAQASSSKAQSVCSSSLCLLFEGQVTQSCLCFLFATALLCADIQQDEAQVTSDFL